MHQGSVRLRVRAEPRAVADPRGARGLSGAGEVTGIVLAGGGSTRFGRDKLQEPYRGAPLLHHAILAVAHVCSEVIVVTPPTGPEPDLPAGVDVRWVRDPVEHGGPLVGLATGLAEARTRWALVVAGDMPGLSPAVLREMVRIASAERAEAVALLAGVDLQPVPQGVSVDPALRSARALLDSGERSLRALLETLEVVPVDEPTWRALDPDGETLRDVDVPADLER